MKYIGKKYTPSDNSWSVNVTQCGDILRNAKNGYLAGTFNTDAIECIIVSEPFTCNTHTTGVSNPKSTHKMIMVEYNGETHMVLFNDNHVK